MFVISRSMRRHQHFTQGRLHQSVDEPGIALPRRVDDEPDTLPASVFGGFTEIGRDDHRACARPGLPAVGLAGCRGFPPPGWVNLPAA